MKYSFVVSSTKFREALQFLSGAIAKNTIVPVLENVKAVIEDGKMLLTASNLQLNLTQTISVDCTDRFVFLIPFRKAFDLLALMPDQPLKVNVEIDGHYNISLVAESGTYKLASEDATVFPKALAVSGNGQDVYELDSADRHLVISAIDNALFAVATDELRPAMCSVCLRLRPDNFLMWTTNGHVLTQTVVSALRRNKERDVLLTRLFAQSLINLDKLTDMKEPMTLIFNQSHIEVKIGDRTAASRLVDEKYPDAQNAIPLHSPITAIVNRLDLIASLKRLALLVPSTGVIALSFKESGLTITAQDLDYGNDGTETLKLDDYQGEGIEIGFNCRNLIECLQHRSGNTVEIELTAQNRAGIIYDQDRTDGNLTLIMPQFINTYA